MKIGEAHRTQSSSLQSANTIGAPKPPAPIVMADRTQKKIRETLLAHHAWSGLPIGGGGHRCANILAPRGPCSITNDTPNTLGAPIRDENQFI
jgi:hypothetical protein